MIDIAQDVKNLSHIGPRMAPRLRRLGIVRVIDLLRHFPNRYEDYTQQCKVGDIEEVGSLVSVRGMVTDIRSNISWRRRRLVVTNATIEDETGSLHAVWFNQPYIEQTLPLGAIVILAGKVSRDQRGIYLSNPTYEKETRGHEMTHTGRFVPVYPETAGISSKYLRFLIKPILTQLDDMHDALPDDVLERNDLPLLADALRGIHFPESLEESEQARKRFAFEDLLLFQLRALQDRRTAQLSKAQAIPFQKKSVADFVKSLPFKLTDDQRRAAFEILQDLERPFPMNRLLNGDVGSGKTVVAVIAAHETIQSDATFQVAFMAPTEILARQHFETLKNLYAKTPNITIGFLTGSEARQWPTDEVTEEKISKKMMQEKIKRGEIRIVVGTHAVIQKNVQFKKLVFVIIDEQHRFGVGQRMALVKGSNKKTAPVPHLLSMTATPIPRTLALTIYGDLDVSLIREKPKGRQRIITRAVESSRRKEAYNFIDKQIAAGRQVFVICPRIEIAKSDEDTRLTAGQVTKKVSISKLLWAEVKAVTDEFERLSKDIFKHRRVAMLHGKMRPKEKQEIMQDFKNHRYDMLISTSVIEVGVDVPNASMMLIESAERFGLAQLHQFRGRVGRGNAQSYCFLCVSGDSAVSQRLKALEKIDSGFELAEIDLKLRGPGEFTGVKQSGIPDLAMASLGNMELIQQSRIEAMLLLKKDSSLTKYPLLKKKLAEMEKIVHFE